jgi:predicted glutamine amidotransferase
MCRMIGLMPRVGSTVDAELLRAFRTLATDGKVKPNSPPGHSDGWGIVAWTPDGASTIYLGREPNDARVDPKYDQALETIEKSALSSPLIAHLRKASVGKKVVENTHPFTRGKWAFAHNGTIRKLNLRDRTDSEWFFNSLLLEIRLCGGDPVCAISRQVRAVREVYRYSSITFLMSDGQRLFAYRDCSKNPDYYTVFYAKTRNSFVVCQEKIFFDSPDIWQELGNGELLCVDRRLNYEVCALSKLLDLRKNGDLKSPSTADAEEEETRVTVAQHQ